jgi:hypothetical protein
MTQLPSPIAVWEDSLSSAADLALARAYWAYNAATGEWTVTTDRRSEAGRLADVAATGEFRLTALGLLSSAMPVLSMTRRSNGAILTYRGSA